MDFYVQSPEMKRTLLESSVGRVTIAANALEANLKLIIAIHSTNDDESFEKVFEKFIPLGSLIKQAKDLQIFDEIDINLLERARARRNEFTHELSDKYTKSINNDGSMYELITDFKNIRNEIMEAADIAQNKLDEMATFGQADVSNIKAIAKNAILEWEKK